MYQPDSPHRVCPRAAVVVAEAVTVAAAVVAIAAAGPVIGVVAHDRAAVAEVTRVAGFNADRVAEYFSKKLRATFCCIHSYVSWCATPTKLFGDCLDCQTDITGDVSTAQETIR
jgi:hypothetical protein